MNTRDPITGLTAKEEHFAQLMALTPVASRPNQSDAYRASHNVGPDTLPKTVWESASVLANLPKVAARIEELKAAIQQQALAATVWTLGRLVEAAEIHRQTALDGGFRGVSAANGALELIGRATGLLADKPTAPSTAIQIVFVTEAGIPKETGVSVVEGKLVDEKAPELTAPDNDNRNKEE